MNAKIPKIPKKTAEDWEWLERQKATPEWQLIRAGLAKILPDNLSRYVGRGIHVTGYGADSPELSDVPTNFELNDENYEIRINDFDINLDWLALHLESTWRRMTSRYW